MPGIDGQVEQLMAEGHFPGAAVAVIRDGAPIHVGTYGMASLEHAVPVHTGTVFELASLTKAMTALAVLSLAEAGELSLDDPVVDYLPRHAPDWAEITIDHLLANTGGLEHRFEHTVEGVLLTDYSTEAMLDSAIATPVRSAAGEDWHYSDQGYFLLGLVIEAVTGERWADHMQVTYFQPLGMAQTRRLEQSAVIAHRAEGYDWVEGETVRNRRVWQFGLMSHFGIMSSLEDMMRWEAELTSPETVSASALAGTAEIRRPFTTGASCETWGYARGWMAHHAGGSRILVHGGYAGTAYLRDLDRGLSVIVLTNRQDGPHAVSPTDIAWAVAHRVEPDLPAGGLSCWE
ncbi:serine hydrolase domain-containing protein [Maricaulis sp. CAU 1757]